MARGYTLVLAYVLVAAKLLHAAQPLLPWPPAGESLATSYGAPDAPASIAVAEDDAGNASVELTARSGVRDGNHYFGVIITLPQPVDLTANSLRVEAATERPEATRAFYIRAYNRDEKKPAWSFNSWNGLLGSTPKTFRFRTGFSPDGPAWEAELTEDRVPDRINRFEFIVGTSEDNAEVALRITALALGPPIVTLAELDKPKAVLRETALVRDGVPAGIILHPDTDSGSRAARIVADAVREIAGVAPPTRPGTAEDRIPDRPAVLLGNVFSNPAMLLLYSRGFTPVDRSCPGPGGSLVHTVCDPFGTGANLIVAGASDDAGMVEAATRLAAAVRALPPGRDAVLPRLFDRNYSAEFLARVSWADDDPDPERIAKGLAEGQAALDTGKHTSVAGVLSGVASRYLLTGHSEEAKLFVALFDLYAASAVADPRKYGGPWGFDSDFRSQSVVPGWDIIEEDPALSDEDRLRTTRHLARWIAEAVVPKCAGAAGSDRVPHNHQTFPALGTLMAGLYFTGHYGVAEGQTWLDIADAVFRRQATFFKPYEDCNGYQWLTNGHLFRYAVTRPDFRVFENGNARRITDFCIGNMDNLAYQVPYGDTGSWQCWSSELVCLEIAAFAAGDADAATIAALKRARRGIRPGIGDFALPGALPDRPPTRFDGVRVWPLEPAYYATWTDRNAPPPEACFDKISFRERMDPDALYLILDGLSNGGHRHYDGNSIPRLTRFDRIWLADNDYFKAPAKFHNTVLVFRDGISQPVPDYAELIGAGESARYGYSVTTVRNYAGTDWERALVWHKESGDLLVLDSVTAGEADAYGIRVLWHGVGDAEPDAGGMTLRQRGPAVRIDVSPGMEVRYADDPELGTNWAGYPHADPVVRTLTAIANVDLAAGETYTVATLFRGAADGAITPERLQMTADVNGVLARGTRGRFGIARGPLRAPVEDGVFESDARIVAVDEYGLTLLGATGAAAGPDVLHESGEPACVDLEGIDTVGAMRSIAVRPPPAPREAGGATVPEIALLRYRPRPEGTLLTGNRGMPGAVPALARLACSPEPPPANAFDPKSPNRPEALTDGGLNTTSESVMFAPDTPVTITLELKEPCRIREVRWHQWWATTSSKNTAYLLKAARVEVSNDGFRDDIRAAGRLADPGEHPNWGTPRAFSLAPPGEPVTGVRLHLEPEPGTAVYLAEIMLFGTLPEDSPLQAGYAPTVLAALPGDAATADALLAGTESGVLLSVQADGTAAVVARFPAAINDVCVADLEGDGIPEILIARQDEQVTVLDRQGNERWSRKLEYYRRPPYANLVRAGDIDGDGKREVICGGENWRFHAYSAAGDLLWHHESVHPSRSGVVADLDGDGKEEVVCGTQYYWMSVLNADGTARWKARFGPICRDIAAGRFAATGGTLGLACGSADGNLYAFNHEGKKLFNLDTGDEVTTVAVLDLDGDGADEILAGSMNDSVYGVEPNGTRLWRTETGAPVTKVVGLPETRRIAAIAGRRLLILNRDGRIAQQAETAAGLVDATPFGNGVAAVTRAGEFVFATAP